QDDGIAPNVVVEAPKEQQISGGLMREAALQGAFKNPGPLNRAPGTSAAPAASAQAKAAYSAPIKADLIGKPDDAQLKAALAYLDQNAGQEPGSTNQPPADHGAK